MVSLCRSNNLNSYSPTPLFLSLLLSIFFFKVERSFNAPWTDLIQITSAKRLRQSVASSGAPDINN